MVNRILKQNSESKCKGLRAEDAEWEVKAIASHDNLQNAGGKVKTILQYWPDGTRCVGHSASSYIFQRI